MNQDIMSNQNSMKSLFSTTNLEFQYRGRLKNSQMHGKGEFKWPDGRHYFGEFFNGTMSGNGKMIWIDKYGGKAKYNGEFI
jgi:hypothetical protein